MEKQNKNDQIQDITEASAKKTTDFAFYLAILVLAGCKDLIEMVLGLIPFLNFLVMGVSLIFSILITLALVLLGKFGFGKIAAFLISQIADFIPILTVLTTTTITILLMIFLEKSPAKKFVQPAANIIKKNS